MLHLYPLLVQFIAATVALAHKLDLQVTAEDIETEDERRILIDCACNFGQGYLFGAPMNAQAFSAWLSTSYSATG